MSPSIVLVDYTGTIAPAELARVAAALQRQVVEHFAKAPPDGWGIPATVRAVSTTLPVHPSEWIVGLFAEPDQPGALGYHDETDSGMPLAKVFPLLDKGDGVSWSVTASHEVLELLADPMIGLCFQAPDGRVWAGEVCDAVENDHYTIDGVEVSNFVLPSYFQPPKAKVPYDFLGKIVSPLEIRPGGYGQVLDPAAGWTMINNGMRAARVASHRSRTAVRRTRAATAPTAPAIPRTKTRP